MKEVASKEIKANSEELWEWVWGLSKLAKCRHCELLQSLSSRSLQASTGP